MPKYKPLIPGVEVTGRNIIDALMDGTPHIKNLILKILQENNIGAPDENKWYKQEDWLNSFENIMERIGPHTVHAIGKKMAENAVLPPYIKDIHQIFEAIDSGYHTNHRLDGKMMFNEKQRKMTDGIGNFNYKKISDNEIEMVCTTPYPCEMDHGVLETMARRFKPQEAIRVNVDHDPNKECKNKGGSSCTYHITW